MVILQQGQIAGVKWQEAVLKYDKEGVGFWVRGCRTILESASYASCVGLVLRGDAPGYGAVAHFWYPSGLQDAIQIVEEYMQWLFRETGGYAGDDVEAVVFGGVEINNPRTGIAFTQARMKEIADYLKERWDIDAILVKQGCGSVELDLTDNKPIEQCVILAGKTLESLMPRLQRTWSFSQRTNKVARRLSS